MAKSIGYILHRFPSPTDTFIRREISTLRALGLDVEVISVWRMSEQDTPSDVLDKWRPFTSYLLPSSILSVVFTILKSAIGSPNRFAKTLILAVKLKKPGIRGLFYQIIYFIESILAANVAIKRNFQHLHNHIGDQSGIVTILAARFTGLKYSITFHGWPVFFDIYNNKIKEKVLGAKFNVCISHFCQSQLMFFAQCLDKSRFKVIHCGLDLQNYPYRKPRPEVKTVFCAARIAPEKGLTFLLEAVSELKRRGYHLTVKLAGDGPAKQQLLELTRELGLTKDVVFLGHLGEEAIIDQLLSSDLFVLPSFVEGLPVSVMEAMATGVPVISTSVGGTSELVEPGRTGMLIRPADVECLVKAMIELITDYKLRLKYSKSGRILIEKEFDITDEIEKLKECFELEK